MRGLHVDMRHGRSFTPHWVCIALVRGQPQLLACPTEVLDLSDLSAPEDTADAASDEADVSMAAGSEQEAGDADVTGEGANHELTDALADRNVMVIEDSPTKAPPNEGDTVLEEATCMPPSDFGAVDSNSSAVHTLSSVQTRLDLAAGFAVS